MPLDGSGTAQRNYSWVADEANDIGIEADRMDEEFDNFADMLSLMIARDGQSTIVADIDFNGYGPTKIKNPIKNGDAVSLGYLQATYHTKPMIGSLLAQAAASDAAVYAQKSTTVTTNTAQTISARKTLTGGALFQGNLAYFAANGTLQPNPAVANVTGVTIGQDYISVSKGGNNLDLNRRGTGGPGVVAFLRFQGAAVGSMSVDVGGSAFNTTSDYRLKANVTDLTGSGTFIDGLRPVSFTWLADGTRDDGFLAHEFAAVCPRAVLGDKDGAEMQAMQASHGSVIANLVAELQSLRARVEELESI